MTLRQERHFETEICEYLRAPASSSSALRPPRPASGCSGHSRELFASVKRKMQLIRS